MAKWTCPGNFTHLNVVCQEWRPLWKYEIGPWLEIWSNNFWGWRLNKSIKPSLVTDGSHSCLVNQHRRPDTCLSRHIYWSMCVFSSSLHQSHFTVIFHPRLPLILVGNQSIHKGWALLSGDSAKTYEHNNTRGLRIELDFTTESPWFRPLHLTLPNTHGGSFIRGLILTLNPRKKGNAPFAYVCWEGQKEGHTLVRGAGVTLL